MHTKDPLNASAHPQCKKSGSRKPLASGRASGVPSLPGALFLIAFQVCSQMA
jgi:hypothetical protein